MPGGNSPERAARRIKITGPRGSGRIWTLFLNYDVSVVLGGRPTWEPRHLCRRVQARLGGSRRRDAGTLRAPPKNRVQMRRAVPLRLSPAADRRCPRFSTPSGAPRRSGDWWPGHGRGRFGPSRPRCLRIFRCALVKASCSSSASEHQRADLSGGTFFSFARKASSWMR